MDAHRDLAHFVEKQRAAVGLLESPLTPRQCPGERAALVTEELRFEQCFAQRCAVQSDEWLVLSFRVLVNRRRDELLAGPGFAVDEYRRAAPSNLCDVLHQALHGGVLPQDVPEVESIVHALTELRRFPGEPRSGERTVDDRDDRVELQGLGQVGFGAELDRLDGGVDGCERRHHDKRGMRRHRPPLLDQRQPIHAGHL